MDLKVALLQMAACGNNQPANRTKGETFCRLAKEMGADIALFPEMWNIGYTSYDAQEHGGRVLWQSQGINDDDPFVLHFCRLARELEMAIALTYLQAWDGAPRNAVSLIDRRGQTAMTYAKVHTCDFGAMEVACTPGEDFHVCSLDTNAGPVNVGAMICFDREAPESARVLMLKGAEVILTPNACALDDRRIEQFRSRAFENAVAVAMTNYASPQHNGHSVAYDAEGALAVEAGGAEAVYLARFDLDAIRAYRVKTIWGNAFRRPHRYMSNV